MSRRGELLTTSSIVEALGEMGFMLLAVGEEGCGCMLMSATMGGMRSGALCTLISDRPKFKAWLWHLLNEKILGELCN